MSTISTSIGLRLIDSHCHVQFPAYDQDREAVIARAAAAGIGVVNVGTQHSTSRDAIALAEQHPEGLWATAGFHPNHLDVGAHHDLQELREQRQEEFDYGKFLELARHPRVVAIGECGLDYYRVNSEQEPVSRIKARQREVFVLQIRLASELKKPLIIHCRKAFDDLTVLLTAHCSLLLQPPGVVHFFSGSWDDARKLLDLGFYLGFGGVITFARDYDEVVKRAPLERILVETDAPYVSPVPHRGTRNEPAYITETTKKIAELRGVAPEEIAVETTANALALFRV